MKKGEFRAAGEYAIREDVEILTAKLPRAQVCLDVRHTGTPRSRGAKHVCDASDVNRAAYMA